MKSIGVLVGIGVAGVFVGAFAMEVVHRLRPNLVKDLESNTKKVFSDMGAAFQQGYQGPPPPAEQLKAGG